MATKLIIIPFILILLSCGVFGFDGRVDKTASDEKINCCLK